MIFGVGTDIVAVKRLATALERHRESFLDRVLSADERAEMPEAEAMKPRFLARRWAAKEAFAKAFRTGVRGEVALSAISIRHDENGAPFLAFSEALTKKMDRCRLRAHLSISDEHDYAVAFVMIEKLTTGETA